MAKKLINKFRSRTAGEYITAHTVIYSTDVEHPEQGRWGKASFWIAEGTDLAGPAVADTVHLRRHINRDDEGLEDPTSLIFQMPRRAESDLSDRARSDKRYSTTGSGRWGGPMLQFAIASNTSTPEVPDPDHWVGLSKVLDMRDATSDPNKVFMGLDHEGRLAVTAYIRRYYGLDS